MFTHLHLFISKQMLQKALHADAIRRNNNQNAPIDFRAIKERYRHVSEVSSVPSDVEKSLGKSKQDNRGVLCESIVNTRCCNLTSTHS